MLQIVAFGSLVLRLALLIFGEYQDRNFAVKYTDIDYQVFTDAAKHVLAGASPYARPTYRYTPLLAYLLTPNITLFPQFGKLLFVLCDLLSGYIIIQLLKLRNISGTKLAVLSSIWLLNPFIATISTRGSSESIMSFLVLASLWAVERGCLITGGLIYGLSVHFKIYPIIYALPLWLYIDKYQTMNKTNITAFFTMNRFLFGIISGTTFIALTYWMYALDGQEFLDETYLYHITRVDDRHNFSFYFYSLLLNKGRQSNNIAKLAAFLPQLLSCLYLGYKFAQKDLIYAVFLQTVAFVAYNKVCTSQYFIWYLTFLPIALSTSSLITSDRRKGVFLLISWVLGQAVWLKFAYDLEFLGENTFRELFASSIVFFLVNIKILDSFARTFTKNTETKKKTA